MGEPGGRPVRQSLITDPEEIRRLAYELSDLASQVGWPYQGGHPVELPHSQHPDDFIECAAPSGAAARFDLFDIQPQELPGEVERMRDLLVRLDPSTAREMGPEQVFTEAEMEIRDLYTLRPLSSQAPAWRDRQQDLVRDGWSRLREVTLDRLGAVQAFLQDRMPRLTRVLEGFQALGRDRGSFYSAYIWRRDAYVVERSAKGDSTRSLLSPRQTKDEPTKPVIRKDSGGLSR